MEMSGQLYTPAALPPGKNPGTDFIGRWAGPVAGLYYMEKKRTSGSGQSLIAMLLT
jgi:hypothetical protein